VAFAADEKTPAGSDEAALAYLAGELADSAEILLASGEDLSEEHPASGGTAAICPECGYILSTCA
jgi:hypothetical protein